MNGKGCGVARGEGEINQFPFHCLRDTGVTLKGSSARRDIFRVVRKNSTTEIIVQGYRVSYRKTGGVGREF